MHTDLLDTVLITNHKIPTASDGTSSSSTATGLLAAARPIADSNRMKESSSGADVRVARDGDEAKCPVDHKTREEWIRQARAAAAAKGDTEAQIAMPHPPRTAVAAATTEQSPTQQSSSSSSWTSRPPPTRPSNHELETGASPTGKWIYPSEKMFFEAMQRKGFSSAAAADMKTVVPIHNAVNERAWQEILRWEAPFLEKDKCGGPRLHSFAGLSESMSPKARFNTLLGYTAPFDRHDWVVDRCGKTVEYVIDFYAGRNDQSGNGGGKLNFYLDVRPKLNSWEGIKMRVLRGTGLA
ncbi:cytochrome c/c1 heme-lyase [Bombardia bombarda]|uniref:Holocytochrome c-type synthase n=1 Tax=Bombardia bombarda TaxID=252184 RepID=A0AA39XAT3_9PEZI|nr:cytochrome c/c1 heme-lyase [Bombardia bombarda]